MNKIQLKLWGSFQSYHHDMQSPTYSTNNNTGKSDKNDIWGNPGPETANGNGSHAFESTVVGMATIKQRFAHLRS